MESDARVRQWATVCEAIAQLLSPHAEVVLHDVLADRVLAIWNPMSGRQVGDESLLQSENLTFAPGSEVSDRYAKMLPDGRQLTSISAVLHRSYRGAELLLCVNLDRGPLERAAELLMAFAAPPANAERPKGLFELDWRERMNDIIGAYVRKRGCTIEDLNQNQRMDLVEALEAAGIFDVRGGAVAAARALKISRATLYNDRIDAKSTPTWPRNPLEEYERDRTS
ncbi:PAS domain-containing protein [Fodinicola acaciae]|uniref:PAS domain-containing protein n=1 Tax=Fodinicola acaciae TaxID=2681555 RepID=UPI0013D2E0E4|nr:PAS domain-containing protein [Fodinicola acaciae]